MLNAVSVEHLDPPIIHHDRYGDGQFPLRAAQYTVNAWIQPYTFCDVIELAKGCIP
jgi:hypothetical protein